MIGGTEGFFTLAYTDTLPENAYDSSGVVVHFEPRRPASTLLDTSVHNGRIDGLTRYLIDQGQFNFDGRKATVHTVPVGIQEETYALIPGRRKCLYYLRDLFEERTGYTFAPVPAIFINFDEMRETLELAMPDLHAVDGKIQLTDWYNMMIEETKEGLIRATEENDLNMIRYNLFTFETCFPREPGFRIKLERAVASPNTMRLRRLLERV